MADLADSSSSARDLFFFRFHIFLVPSHLPSLLGESHKDSGMGKQNKKDSCKNTKSAQSQHLELSVMLHGDYCSYPNWEKQRIRLGVGLILFLCPEAAVPSQRPIAFLPGAKRIQPEGTWTTREQPQPNNQGLLMLQSLA